MTFTHIYVGRLRPDWHGRDCRVTVGLKGKRRGMIRNVRVEFFDGSTTVCPMRCLRRVKPAGHGPQAPQEATGRPVGGDLAREALVVGQGHNLSV